MVEKAATPPPIKKIHFAADVEENKIQPPAPDDKNNEEDEEEDEYYEFWNKNISSGNKDLNNFSNLNKIKNSFELAKKSIKITKKFFFFFKDWKIIKVEN